MIIKGTRQISNRSKGIIVNPFKRKIIINNTPAVDSIKSYLTTNLTAYNNASVGNFIKVTKTEYDNIAANIIGVLKKGNSDEQINTRASLTSWQDNWISFGASGIPTFQIDAGEYVIGFISEAWNQNTGTSQLGYTTTFNGSTITNIGNAAGLSSGGARDYYIRKAPTDPATETRYPVLKMSVSPNGVSNWNGYRSADNGSSWIALPNNQISKIQILVTSTKSW